MSALTFVAPPPGLDGVDFELEPVSGAAGLFTLVPDSAPGQKMFLLDAAVYLPDYRPVIGDAHTARIGADSGEDITTLVVANHRNGGTTVNLIAPVLVNRATRAAAQVILEGQGYDVRSVLTPA